MLGSVGCATTASRIAEGGVEGSLDALSQPESQRDAEKIATSDEIQNATEAISASVTRGILAGLTTGDDGDKLREAAGSYMDDAGPRIEQLMREDIAPGVAAIVRQSVEASLATATSEENQARTREIVAATTHTAVRAATAALAEGIREDLVPAIAEIDTAAMDSRPVQTALGGIAHEVSRQAVLGSQAGLAEVQDTAERTDEPGLLGGLADQIAIGWATMIAFVVALALTLVVLIMLVIKGRSQRRHLEADARQREDMLLTLARSLASGGRLSPEQEQALLLDAKSRTERAPPEGTPQPRRPRFDPAIEPG
jgi:hypothetical protein